MRSVRVWLGVLLALSTWPALGWAQAPTLPEDEDEEPVAPSLPAAGPALPDEEEEPEAVEDRLARVEAELAQADLTRPTPSIFTFDGYLDFGFYAPSGDGAGIIQDFDDRTLSRVRPGDAGRYAWVFLGDLLGTMVNSRGEAADLGPEPGIERFDSIDSKGAMGFVLNEANLVLEAGLGPRARASLGVNVVPRTGGDFALGDFIELDLAQLEVVISEEMPTSLFVGKVEPVIGVEYKRRKSNTRFGITPSLLARYTIGPQLGLKARSKLLDGWLIIAAAVTNQSSTQEQFHFYEETDSNDGKTGSGRLALRIPLERWFPEVFAGGLELAGDLLIGAQDRALDSEGLFRLYGFDFEYQGVDLALRGQFLKGRSPGRASDGAYALDLVAAGYAELELLITPIFGAYGRADFRNAWVTLGDSRAYLTKTWRLTGGLRASINRHLTLKAEYVRNFEYRELPAFDNDIFTSSLVISY